MTDVLDLFELLESEGFARRQHHRAVPIPALPLPRRDEDNRQLAAHPAGLESMRRCLDEQATVPTLGRVHRMLGVDPVALGARHYLQLAREERRFTEALTRPSLTVLNAVPIERDRDLDHLVLGPFGVMVVSTVHAGGHRVAVDGRRLSVGAEYSDALERALALQEDVASRLSVAVGHEVPVLSSVVVLGRTRISIVGRPEVPVLSGVQLVRLLWRLEPRYTLGETAELTDAAARASTWRERPAPESASLAAESAFRELERRSDTARRRRTIVEFASLGAIVAAMVFAASGAPAAIAAALSAALAG